MKNIGRKCLLRIGVIAAFSFFLGYPGPPGISANSVPAPSTALGEPHEKPAAYDKDWARPEKRVESFCAMQFDGVGTYRDGTVKYTPKAAKREIANDPYDIGFNYSWDVDPAIIVESFRITGVTTSGNRGTATVVYKRLARLGPSVTDESRCRTLEKDFLERDIVTLTLRRVKEMWWIMDPPPPRVSLKAFSDYHEDAVRRMSDWIYVDSCEIQRRAYECKLKTLEFLKGLGGKAESTKPVK